MGILQVALLGTVRVTHDNWRTEAKLSKEIQSLLAYLVLQRNRVHPREMLAGIFWAEHNQEKARRALNTALWRLKKALEPGGIPAGTYLIVPHSGDVGFNCQSQYWLDAEIFEQEVKSLVVYPTQKVSERQIQDFEKNLDLYRGELLEGFYDEWALRERERLRAIYLKSLIYLMQYYKSRKLYEKAISYGQQLLNLDPLREDIHREMMRLFLESGQRALAARQYRICQLTLAKELDISPMEETQALYAKFFPKALKNHISPAFEGSINFEQALEQLRQVSRTIELAREQVQQTFQFLTKHIESDEKK